MKDGAYHTLRTLFIILCVLCFSAAIASAGQVLYQYDNSGQLTSASFSDGETQTQMGYNYDNVGNISTKSLGVQFSMDETSSGNGAITASSDTVTYGGGETYTITPGSGYSLLKLTDNGTDVTGSAVLNPGTGKYTYTLANVTSGHNVVATFSDSVPVATPALGWPGFIIATSLLAFLALQSARRNNNRQEKSTLLHNGTANRHEQHYDRHRRGIFDE